MRVTALVVVVVASVASCAPFAGAGEPCDRAPCAPGLICGEAFVCTEPPPPPPPPCEQDRDCLLDGDASGRVCEAGVCRFADCLLDAQCGTRICVDGSCAPRIPCLRPSDCSGGSICDDGACRPPCQGDDDCALSVGGISLQACVAGRCLQRCLGDATCLSGGVCEENVCQDPECAVDNDCSGADTLCTNSRCEFFTPCQVTAECFDANFICDTTLSPSRCVELPACRNDAACGFDGVCLDRHCRPATACGNDAGCSSNEECLGGRCVRAPECRSESDCNDGQRCAGLRCVAAPARPEDPDTLTLSDDVGVCNNAGCARVLVVGESFTMYGQGYDPDAAPLDTTLDGDSSDPDVAEAASSRARITITAKTAGTTNVTVSDGVENIVVAITVVDDAAFDELAIIVVDHEGALRSDVIVDFDDGAAARVPGLDGVVRVTPLPVSLAISARAASGAGVVVVGSAPTVPTTLRLMLPPPPPSTAGAATARATITSTGDELGAVGLGLAVPSVASPDELTEQRLLGDVVAATFEVPIIGAIPFSLPSGMTMDATLQLGGAQVPRAEAEMVVAPGPAFALALEDRREQDVVIGLVLGADPISFARELVGDSETADALIASLGVRDILPLIADVNDRDGDGNVVELVPNFAASAVVDVRPSQSPQERSSVVAVPPAGASGVLMWAGFVVPGALVPAGVSMLRGLTDFEGSPLPESFRAVAAPIGFARARRAVAVTALFDDATLESRAFVAGDALPRQATFGALFQPPTGARLLDDLPAAGEKTALLPAPQGDLVRLRLRDAQGTVDVYAAPASSLRLPRAALQGTTTVLRTHAFTVGGLFALHASPVGTGPKTVDVTASKAASAPGG